MHQRFGGIHCLHPHDGETEAAGSFHTLVPNKLDGITYQNVISAATAVETSNIMEIKFQVPKGAKNCLTT
jgi:hypothetical protein